MFVNGETDSGPTPEKAPTHGGHKGVATLLGDPKKAIIKLSIPMILAMSVQTIYNVVDAFWVSLLGADELAAVGFFFPFFFLVLGIGMGLGIGGGAAISRRIGAKDKRGADSVATQTLVIMLLVGIIFTLPFVVFSEQLFLAVGAGAVTPLAVSYGSVMFAGTLIILFPSVGTSILRSEGDAKRAMYAMMLGSGLNIVLDPIFIFTLNLGIAGAAWATLVSFGISSILILYWLVLKKDTFISLTTKEFKFEGDITRDIFRVGLPAMVMQMSMSLNMLAMNFLIVGIPGVGTDGVAVFSTGWRIVTIGILPILGISTAVVSVVGAAYGAKEYGKLNTAYMYSIKIGETFEIPVTLLIYTFAIPITAAFTMADATARIAGDLTFFFQISCLFFPGAVLGICTSAMFQGIGKGTYALIATLMRTLGMTLPLSYLFAYPLGYGLPGIWWGLVIGNVTGSVVIFIWGKIIAGRLGKKGVPVSE